MELLIVAVAFDPNRVQLGFGQSFKLLLVVVIQAKLLHGSLLFMRNRLLPPSSRLGESTIDNGSPGAMGLQDRHTAGSGMGNRITRDGPPPEVVEHIPVGRVDYGRSSRRDSIARETAAEGGQDGHVLECRPWQRCSGRPRVL